MLEVHLISKIGVENYFQNHDFKNFLKRFIAFAFNAKRFAIAILFFLFFIPSVVFGWTDKSFSTKFR